jgi:hypothetical protein
MNTTVFVLPDGIAANIVVHLMRAIQMRPVRGSREVGLVNSLHRHVNAAFARFDGEFPPSQDARSGWCPEPGVFLLKVRERCYRPEAGIRTKVQPLS